nr:hypothetical protein [Acidobacteriota bacterium]
MASILPAELLSPTGRFKATGFGHSTTHSPPAGEDAARYPTLQSYYDLHWPIGAISKRTARTEEGRFAHVLAFLGGRELRTLTGADVRDLQNRLKRAGLA